MTVNTTKVYVRRFSKICPDSSVTKSGQQEPVLWQSHRSANTLFAQTRTHSHFPKTLTTVTADQKLKAPLLDPQVEEDVVGAM